MLYAQINSGEKLHLVGEAGDEIRGHVVRRGRLSLPLCGRRNFEGYRMTINVPLAHACQNCLRVWRAGKWAVPSRDK